MNRYERANLVLGCLALGTAFALMLGTVLVLLACLSGCTTVKGGTTHRDSGALRVIVHDAGGGIVEVTDNREQTATTQPSVQSPAGTDPKIGPSSEGVFGQISFNTLKRTLADRYAWPLGLLLLGVAGFLAWLKHYLAAAAAAAAGFLAILFPSLLALASLLVVGGALYLAYRYIRQSKGAIGNILGSLPAEAQAAAAGVAREATDTRVQKTLGL